jgi:chemosensory pili system protein ChpC
MTVQTLYAVMIAIDGDTLLLPNSAVAEVVSRESAIAHRDGVNGWLGDLEWNGRSIPVVQLETLMGRPLKSTGRRARIVILHSLVAGGGGRHLAIVAQGYPHLVTLNPAALSPEPLREDDDERWVLGRCRVASQSTLIPDLAAVDAVLAGTA